ncbi:MAG: esterase [Alphaproteobacteria bacterium]|nr:esterase [Alphaproteobacteria bacterium]
MPQLFTTLGPKTADELGFILPHEHVFVDLRTPDRPGYAEADTDEVVRVMAPRIAEIKAEGVTALVECTTGGVGRRADIDLAVSEATDFPIVVPTGNYREPWIPDWVRIASEADLEAWMTRELNERLGEADFKAGWIKLSAGDDGITELETRILRAAVRAAKRCNATIGSHTIKGRVVMDQLDIIEREGGDPSRFISIHTQAEPDFELHKAVAARGAWIEFDNAGWVPDEDYLKPVLHALDAGLERQMLLSHDAGWYDPAKPHGGEQKPYTVLAGSILPALRQRGVGAETIRLLTHANPFNAFAR